MSNKTIKNIVEQQKTIITIQIRNYTNILIEDIYNNFIKLEDIKDINLCINKYDLEMCKNNLLHSNTEFTHVNYNMLENKNINFNDFQNLNINKIFNLIPKNSYVNNINIPFVILKLNINDITLYDNEEIKNSIRDLYENIDIEFEFKNNHKIKVVKFKNNEFYYVIIFFDSLFYNDEYIFTDHKITEINNSEIFLNINYENLMLQHNEYLINKKFDELNKYLNTRFVFSDVFFLMILIFCGVKIYNFFIEYYS